MQEALRDLIVRYCENLAEQVSEVSQLLHALDAGSGGDEHIARALDLTHQMTGLSGSMGYPAVSTAAAILEKQLRLFEDTASLPNRSERAELLAQFGQLQSLAADVTPERSGLFNVDPSQFAVQAG